MRKNIIKITSICCVFIAILIAILSLTIIWTTEKHYRNETTLTTQIHLVGDYSLEGSNKQHPLPIDGNIELTNHNKMIINGHFTEPIEKNKQIIMRLDNLSLKLFVNDNLIYSFGEKESIPNFSKSPGNLWVSMISPGISIEDEITVEISNHYTNHVSAAYSDFLSNIYSGYESEVMLTLLKNNAFSYAVSILAMILGVITLITSVIFFKLKDIFNVMISFACMSISSGIWFFIDFQIQSYLINSPIFNNSLDILIMLLAIISLLMYVATFLTPKTNQPIYILIIFISISIFISTFMQLSGIQDYYFFVPLITIICAICSFTILGTIFYERFILKNKKIKNLFISSIILCAGIGGDVILMSLKITSHIFCIKLSYIFFLIIQVIFLVQTIRNMLVDNIRINILEEIAYKDTVTNLQNRAAYTEKVEKMNQCFSTVHPFGVIVFDINNLKIVNDNYGHKEGDQLILEASKIISSTFNENSIFRIGGDEFVVILEKSQYVNCDSLLNKFKQSLSNHDNLSIACGLACYNHEEDLCYETVFNRADQEMYKDKQLVKQVNNR